MINQVVNQLGGLVNRIYKLDVPKQLRPKGNAPDGLKSVAQLVKEGSLLEPIEELHWESGQGAKQVAYLCPTSGTSGIQVGWIVPHYSEYIYSPC